MKSKEHQSNTEANRVSGTKNLESGVNFAKADRASPSINEAYKKVPGQRVHTR